MTRSRFPLGSGRRRRSVSLGAVFAISAALTPVASMAQAPQPTSYQPGILSPNTRTGALTHSGRDRDFLVHVPPSYSAAEATPLVIALHGGTGTAGRTEWMSGLSGVSDKEGFIVVYPNGVGRTWNDGRGLPSFQAMRENVDDVGFIATLIDTLSQQFTIDQSRVYVTGMSNGGHMAHRLGVELADRIAAIAPVAASMPLSVSKAAPPGKPMSVIQFFGTEDRHNYWGGGGRAGGLALSVPDVMGWWAHANRCATTPKVEAMPDVVDDGTRIRRETYAGCANGAEVILYAIEGGGHNGPGWQQYLPVGEIGRTSRDMNASEAIWAFFSRHRRGSSPDLAKPRLGGAAGGSNKHPGRP